MLQHPLALFNYCPRCGSNRFEINNFKSKICTACNFIYYFNSSTAAAAFITDPKGRLLVAKRAKDPAIGTFDLPGGFVDLDETAEDAIKREIFEETGLTVETLRYVFSLPNIYTYSGFDVHTVDLFYECQVHETGKLHPADDVSDLFFLEKAEIDPALFGLNSIRKAVEHWLKQS